MRQKGYSRLIVQVKSGSGRASRSEIRKLRALAKKKRGTAVVIHSDKNGEHWTERWTHYGNWTKRHKRN